MGWAQTANIKGPIGDTGPPGPGMVFKGQVATVGDLPTDALPGDAYTVEEDGHMYVWDGAVWVDGGSVKGEQGEQGIPGPPGEDGSPDTAAQILAKLVTVDGPGSGLDADLLDGQSGTAYLARANHTGTQAIATVSGLQAALDAKAPLASPALTGAPTAPTATPGTNSTQIASTAFVAAALATTGAHVGTSAPATAVGKMWWHTTEKTLRIWDGTAWEPVFGTWA